MRVITRKALQNFCADNPELDAEQILEEWYRAVLHAEWEIFADVRKTYKSADAVDHFVVFNVGGHRLRVITVINYVAGKVFIRKVLTHKDYDKGLWKNDEFGKRGWKPIKEPLVVESATAGLKKPSKRRKT